MRINTTYNTEDEVYHRTYPDQEIGVITGITIRPNGIAYLVTFGQGNEITAYEFEISKHKRYDFN